jgi:hypothetical protein
LECSPNTQSANDQFVSELENMDIQQNTQTVKRKIAILFDWEFIYIENKAVISIIDS